MINDNKAAHYLKIKAVFDGKYNFFTSDGPAYQEIRL